MRRIGKIVYPPVDNDDQQIEYVTIVERYTDAAYIIDKTIITTGGHKQVQNEIVVVDIDKIDELITLLQKAKEQAGD